MPITEGKRTLPHVRVPALLVVGASFAVSVYLAAFASDADSRAQAAIGVVGMALPALVILLAIRPYNGSVTL